MESSERVLKSVMVNEELAAAAARYRADWSLLCAAAGPGKDKKAEDGDEVEEDDDLDDDLDDDDLDDDEDDDDDLDDDDDDDEEDEDDDDED